MYVYLMGNKDLNYYKIGISQNPATRRRDLQQGLPFELTVLYRRYVQARIQFIERELLPFI